MNVKKENLMRVFLLIFVFFFQSHAYAEEPPTNAHEQKSVLKELESEFIVIVNTDGPLNDADAGVLREVYLGEKRFAGSTRLMPVHFPEGALKDAFLKTVVGMSPREYKHYCIEKLFQEGLTFRSIGIPVDVIEFVGKEKGAVAYLPPSWAEAIRSGVAKGSLRVMIVEPEG